MRSVFWIVNRFFLDVNMATESNASRFLEGVRCDQFRRYGRVVIQDRGPCCLLKVIR